MKQNKMKFILFALGLALLSLHTAFATTVDCAAKKKEEKIITKKNIRIDGMLYTEIQYKKVKKKNKTTIALLNCETKGDILKTPASIEGYPVTVLAESGMSQYQINQNQKYKKIIISEGVKKIEESKFSYNGSQEFVLPKSLESVGEGAFEKWEGKRIIVKGKKTVFGVDVFVYSTMQKISLPKDFVGKLGSGCFGNSKLRSFIWPKYMPPKNIGEGIFWECKKLKKVTFPAGIKQVYLPAGTFTHCNSLKKLVFPKSVKKVTYLNSGYADNYKYGVGTLVFQGKNTKVIGCKYIGREKYKFITVGKIIAPKGSKAIAFAKKAKKITYLPLTIRQTLEVDSPPLKPDGFFELHNNYSDPSYRVDGLLDLGDLSYEIKG